MKLFSILFFSSLLLFAACSQEDCSTLDSTYEKYGLDEETKECVVVKTIQQNECGNSIIEDGENFCSCSGDVTKTHPTLGCTGTQGEYLENTCNAQNECVLVQNDKVVKETKVVQLKNSDLTLEAEFTLHKPFFINVEDEKTLDVSISLFKLNPTATVQIKNVKVSDLKVENSKGTLFASKDFGNAPLAALNVKLPFSAMGLADTTEYESRESLKAKAVVSYAKEVLNSKGEIIKTEEKIETLSISLGSYDIINPVFDN